MRQNMEELEATQEEMRRKEKHIQSMLGTEKERNDANHRSRQIVLELTKDRDVQAGNWNSGIGKDNPGYFTATACFALSIWIFDETSNTLRNEKLYQANTGAFESGSVLSATDYPAYFRSLLQQAM